MKTTYENTNNIREQRAVAAEEALAVAAGKLARVKASKTRVQEAREATILQLELDLAAAIHEHDEAVEAWEQRTTEARERIAIRDAGARGRRIAEKFVRHARTLLSTGGSARATLEQLHLNATFFLSEEDYKIFQDEVPSVRWFQYQREGMGLESYLYTLMRVAKCERVVQWGFDETSLDGWATLNQWVRIEEEGQLHVVTLECAGLLSGSTTQKVCEHIRVYWERGQEAMGILREALGEDADTYAPLVNGGISLSKLCGVMHDTCNSANSIARAVRVLRDDSGRDLYSQAEWQRMEEDHEREWVDFLCGNHSRNLHIDAYARNFEAYVKVLCAHITTPFP
jgi:hypothetical protein